MAYGKLFKFIIMFNYLFKLGYLKKKIILFSVAKKFNIANSLDF